MVEIQTTEYLAQLLKDKKQLAAFPNVFNHLERLLDEGKQNITRQCSIKLHFSSAHHLRNHSKQVLNFNILF